MFLATFVEKMDFVGCSDSYGRVDRNVGDCDSDDTFMTVLQLLDGGFGKETHT